MSTHKESTRVVSFSLLIHLSSFIKYTNASVSASLKMGQRRKGTRNHGLGNIPGEGAAADLTPVSITTSLQLLPNTGFRGTSDTAENRELHKASPVKRNELNTG